jgi:transcriptional regulator with XRE-family HTH domain
MRNLPPALLPNRIREHRKRQGMTLDALAGQLNCSITQVSDLEHGNRQLTQAWMKRISRALKIQPAELLPIDDAVALTDEEKQLLQRYRVGTGVEQEMLLAIARIIVRVPL